MWMACAIIITRNGLHPLTNAENEHHTKAAKSINDSVSPHSEVAAIMDELLVEQRDHTRSGHIHQERTHADKQNIAENVEFRLPRMATETDEGTSLQKVPNGNNTRTTH